MSGRVTEGWLAAREVLFRSKPRGYELALSDWRRDECGCLAAEAHDSRASEAAGENGGLLGGVPPGPAQPADGSAHA